MAYTVKKLAALTGHSHLIVDSDLRKA